MTAKKTKLGRPRRENHVATARMVARCTEAELREAEKAAQRLGLTTSEFVRRAVLTIARDHLAVVDW